MRFAFAIVLASLFATGALAQPGDGATPLLLVHLKFSEGGIQIAKVDRGTGHRPFFLGFAQSRPLFLEVTDGNGHVIYAEEVRDPRQMHGGSNPQEPKSSEGKPTQVDTGVAVIAVPAQNAAEVRVYRRVNRGKTYRQEIARASVP
jgi:hypothetical protein